LRGLAPLRTFTREGIEEARRYFSRAIEIDPNYARAHANLALTYGTSIIFRLGDNTTLHPIAVKEAELAVQLDPTLSQAQFALAVVRLAGRDFDAAIQAAREAIRLDPNYADGYAVLAQSLAFADKDEALSAIRTAMRLSPCYTFAYLWVEGHILFQLHRYQEARTILEEVVARNPAFLLGYLTLAATYGHLGLVDEADWISVELLTMSPK
jgi:adenylate cyclase